jgi:hypothetical protein
MYRVLLSSMKLSTGLSTHTVFGLVTEVRIDFIKHLLYTELMNGQDNEVVTL